MPDYELKKSKIFFFQTLISILMSAIIRGVIKFMFIICHTANVAHPVRNVVIFLGALHPIVRCRVHAGAVNGVV